MSECVNWPVLLAVLGLALGLFFIVLLTGCFLMGCFPRALDRPPPTRQCAPRGPHNRGQGASDSGTISRLNGLHQRDGGGVTSPLKVEQWPIDRLIEYARNPRKNDAKVDQMATAIREFGFRIPIVAKSDGSVVDGHLRLKAARKLGLTEVPVALAGPMRRSKLSG
jgi:ParB-like nuclease domain